MEKSTVDASDRPGLSAVASTLEHQDFIDFYRREVEAQVRRAGLMLGSADLANDVVHDAFVAVLERWSRIAEPGPYLNRVVLNGCRAAAKRRQRGQAALVDEDHRLSAERAPDDDYLFDVLVGLPFNQRAAVVLRFYGGLTETAIAEVLDCRPGSVGPWIQRALIKLRKELS